MTSRTGAVSANPPNTKGTQIRTINGVTEYRPLIATRNADNYKLINYQAICLLHYANQFLKKENRRLFVYLCYSRNYQTRSQLLLRMNCGVSLLLISRRTQAGAAHGTPPPSGRRQGSVESKGVGVVSFVSRTSVFMAHLVLHSRTQPTRTVPEKSTTTARQSR